MAKARTLDTVRERERESYTLVTESAVLFNSLTHTSSLEKNEKIIEKEKKDSIKPIIKDKIEKEKVF